MWIYKDNYVLLNTDKCKIFLQCDFFSFPLPFSICEYTWKTQIHSKTGENEDCKKHLNKLLKEKWTQEDKSQKNLVSVDLNFQNWAESNMH